MSLREHGWGERGEKERVDGTVGNRTIGNEELAREGRGIWRRGEERGVCREEEQRIGFT